MPINKEKQKKNAVVILTKSICIWFTYWLCDRAAIVLNGEMLFGPQGNFFLLVIPQMATGYNLEGRLSGAVFWVFCALVMF